MDGIVLTPRAFDVAEALEVAQENCLVFVFGAPKTGKTHFALRSGNPRYVAYLDTLPVLEYAVLKAGTEGYDPKAVEFLKVPPLLGKSYEDFTQADAQRIVQAVEDFAATARNKARAAKAAGQPVGTFVLDGMTLLKGYYEKAILGESATLGYRAEKGERGGPSRFAYARSNAALRDFVTQFAVSPLDVVMTWEGRPKWEDDKPTARYKSTRPDLLPYCVNAEVETIKILEPVVERNVQVGERVIPSLRIHYSSYDPALDGRVMKARGFTALKEVFLATLDEAEELLLPQTAPVVEVAAGLGD